MEAAYDGTGTVSARKEVTFPVHFERVSAEKRRLVAGTRLGPVPRSNYTDGIEDGDGH